MDDTNIALTGDRPTGPLHIGHYVGSLRNRSALQHTHKQYILVADAQALTDNLHRADAISRHSVEIVADYIASGVDPDLSTICLQSQIPALGELTLLYLNLVTVARLERNPTIREEVQSRGFERNIPAGFLCYPVAQAADITAFGATVVPAGEDQAPLIELTNEVVRNVNRRSGKATLNEVSHLLSQTPRLPGADGKTKMSKSQGNAIPLGASNDEIATVVKSMFTDPEHLKASDPGRVEGNVVFTYLDAFDPDVEAVAALKSHYRRGGLGDAALKERLTKILVDLIAPIRERRHELLKRPDRLLEILRAGTETARAVTSETLERVKSDLRLRTLI